MRKIKSDLNVDEAIKLFSFEKLQQDLSDIFSIQLKINTSNQEEHSFEGYINWQSEPIDLNNIGIAKFMFKSLIIGGSTGIAFYLNDKTNTFECFGEIKFIYDAVNSKGNTVSIGYISGIFKNGKWESRYDFKNKF